MRTIDAYDASERVRRYDADMDVMHPLRHEMIEVCLQALTWEPEATCRVLDLGTGTGVVAQRILECFSAATVVAIDGAASMIEMARSRLQQHSQRTVLIRGDLLELQELLAGEAPFDGILTAFTLHHLTASEKKAVFEQCLRCLKPGGQLLNADIVISPCAAVESRVQQLRVDGIVHRAAGRNPRYRDATTTRASLDTMEADEGDQPLTVRQDMEILSSAGFQEVDLYWKEYRECVTGGRRG